VALLVLAAAVVAVAAPRAVADIHTASLERQLAERPASELDLTTTSPFGPDAGPSERGTTLPDDVEAVWGGQEERLDDIRRSLPRPLRAATEAPFSVAVSGPVQAHVPGAGPGSPVYRIEPGFDPRMREHLRLVEGDWPAPLPGSLAEPHAESVEVVLAAPVAEAMSWEVGAERTVDYTGVPVTVRLAGIVEAVDPGAGFWTHLPTALRASVVDNGISPPEYTAVAWFDPASWPDFAPMALALRMQAWIPVDVGAIQAADAGRIAGQLGEFASTSQVLGSGRAVEIVVAGPPGSVVPYLGYSTVGTVGFTTGLRDALVEATVAAASVDAVLATIASGPIGVAIAVLVLGARVVFERRRGGLELAAARGASPGQLRGILLVEGLVLGVPAGIAGGAVATALTPGSDGVAGWWIAAVLALTPAALLVARAGELTPLRRARADLGSVGGGRWRVVVEALVVLVAATSVVLLFQRGTAGAAQVGVDPLLAATPLLLALAACVLVLRLYPLPLGALVRRMSRRADLVPFLGSARALRDPSAGLVPVLAVVVGVSVAVASSVVLATLDAGIDTASDRRVGADLAVSGVPLTRAQLAEIEAAEGVEAIAPVYSTRPARLDVDGRTRSTTLIVVDRAELARVQAGRPDALALPAALGDEGSDPAPVVVSDAIAGLISSGDDVSLESHDIDVLATAEPQSPFTPRDAWVLVDRVNAEPFTDRLVPRSVLVRLSPGAEADAVGATVAAIAGDGAVVATAAGLAADIRSMPDSRGLRTGLVAAIAIATLLTALALALTLLVGQSARARLLPLLATLGLGQRGERAIVAWEIAPVTVVAVVAGAALGALVPVVVLNGVDLRTFTGGAVAPAVTYDWALMGVVVVASVAVSAVAAGVAAHVGGRVSAARAMRKEEEG
jgi:putative ABC transport system permease protein